MDTGQLRATFETVDARKLPSENRSFFRKKVWGFPARALSSTVDTGYEMHIIESYVFFNLYSAYSILSYKLHLNAQQIVYN